jgi:hypothetical protein
MLKFSKQNAKTENLAKVAALAPYLAGKKKIYSLDLSSGVSCPGAKDCRSMAVVNPLTGRATIKDSPGCQFRCFSASQEVLFPALRKLRAHNFDLIKSAQSVENIAKLISDSLPSNAGIVRLHVGGDFFSLNYLLAVVKVAESHPNILFYSYTKSLHHLKVVGGQDLARGVILPNFLITASYGGHYDHLITELGVRAAYVVYTELEADTLPIDHDDSHAATSGGDFALLLHGTQPANTPAGEALKLLKKAGVGSYNRKAKV